VTRGVLDRLRLRRIRRLTSGTIDHEHPAWSPDGRTLAFTAGPADVRRIYLVDRKGRFGSGVAPGGPQASRPRWAPDGRRLAFEVRSSEGAATIVVQDLPDMGLDPRVLVAPRARADAAPAPALYVHAGYSPDGRSVAYASDEGSPGHIHLWILDLETQGRRQLTDVADRNDAHPAFSPDGTVLAFHGYQGQQATQSSLYLLNIQTGALLRLTDAPGFDKHACFATQDVIVFHREHPDGSQELRALHVIEGSEVPIELPDGGKRDAKQPAVRITRRGRIRVAFAGRPRETRAGSPHPYDLYIAALSGLSEGGS
jgi:Tol biopolymer transport system component